MSTLDRAPRWVRAIDTHVARIDRGWIGGTEPVASDACVGFEKGALDARERLCRLERGAQHPKDLIERGGLVDIDIHVCCSPSL
jgi:hypothetical protein